ncbi:hypothetical protein HK100_000928 [Physocladia obscura]|uniref:RING-type domain-containing protein n=1 Tax=Physocladia obscura TaxID=109957 RepID=A0AAD5SYK4_9FUNG|nr:hypothetical protein HK100_000928 [Physocladia obscura]
MGIMVVPGGRGTHWKANDGVVFNVSAAESGPQREAQNRTYCECGFSTHGVNLNIDAPHDLLSDNQSNRSVYVAQCSHVICTVCLGLTNTRDNHNQLNEPPYPAAIPAAQCPICQTTCALVRIDPTAMPDDIKLIISPFIVALENALEVAKFQYGNATSLIKFLKHSSNSQIAQMKAAIKSHAENSRSQNFRIKNLQEELAASKQDVKELKQQLTNNKQQARLSSTPAPNAQLQQSRQATQQPLFNFQPQNNQQMQQPSLQYQQQYRHQSSRPQQTSVILSPTQPQQQKSQVLHTPLSPSRLSLQPQTRNHQQQQQQQQQHVSSANSNSSMQANQSFERVSSSLSLTEYASNSMTSIDVAGSLAFSPTRQFQRARPETASGAFASPKYASSPSKQSNRIMPQYMRQSTPRMTDAAADGAARKRHHQHQKLDVNYAFDDAETFQRQKQIKQQQQMQQIQHSGRPASMATGNLGSMRRSGPIASMHNGPTKSSASIFDRQGGERSGYNAVGKTMLNRQSFIRRAAGTLGSKRI